MVLSIQLTGPRVIGSMFLFAISVTAGLWGYWELHTRPFRPLTLALAEEFPGSRPRVEGGKHGFHKQTPKVLRVVMKVDFDPEQNEHEFQERVQGILELMPAHHPVENYDLCEIHLFQQRPEQDPVLRSTQISVDQISKIRSTDLQQIDSKQIDSN